MAKKHTKAELVRMHQKLKSFYSIIDILMEEKDSLRGEMGLDDIEYVDHVQGTNMDNYRCKLCGKVWCSSEMQVCLKCHVKEG